MGEKSIENDDGRYEPEARDLIAITNVRPKCIADLERPDRYYVVAFVLNVKKERYLTILSSKPILFEEHNRKIRKILYAIPLINMTTNIRLWSALNSELAGGNLNIIQRVLQSRYPVRFLVIDYFMWHIDILATLDFEHPLFALCRILKIVLPAFWKKIVVMILQI
jgi:hypothetical protein